MARGRKLIDLTGRQFGALSVLRRSGTDAHRHPIWECRCACGRHWRALGYCLTEGRLSRCGFCRTEMRRAARALKGKNVGDHVSHSP